MTTLQGCEFHSANRSSGPYDRYCRVVCHGPEVIRRSGIWGRAPELETMTFESPYQATQYLFSCLRRGRQEGYVLAHLSDVILVPDVALHPTPGRFDPEQFFLDAWAAQVGDEIAGPARLARHRNQWAIFTGLATQRDTDPTAAAILDMLIIEPHAISPAPTPTTKRRDHIVGQVVHLPLLQDEPERDTATDIRGHATACSLLGPIDNICVHATPSCTPCAQRVADLLLYLCRGLDLEQTPIEDRRRLVATAYRLVRAHTTPVPA